MKVADCCWYAWPERVPEASFESGRPPLSPVSWFDIHGRALGFGINLQSRILAHEEMDMTEPITAMATRVRRALSECDGPTDIIVVVAEGALRRLPGEANVGGTTRTFRQVKFGGAA